MPQALSVPSLPYCFAPVKISGQHVDHSKPGFVKCGKAHGKKLCPMAHQRKLIIASGSGILDKDDSVGGSDLGNWGFSGPPKYYMATKMKRSFNPLGGGVATPEKVTDMPPPTTKPKAKEYVPKTADGDGGGDIGKKIYNGGGDGGDDGGDDDDYFGDFDEEDDGGDEGGFFRRRMVNHEIFDRKIVEAVLQEWYKTITDLPAGLLQACELGLVSSAQMVRYLSMNARPTFARTLSRNLPESVSREFVGRMIADPGFLHKLLLEQTATICCTGWWEIYHRQERMKEEWHLALLNVLTASACNAAIVWSLAPCRSYGGTFRYDLQNTIQKLPNNVFEKSYPLREFDIQKRVQSFFYKAAELCLVGVIAGSANGAVTKLLTLNERTSITIPSIKTSALSYGALLGLSGNLRYQTIFGLERLFYDHFDVLAVGVLSSMALRAINIKVGDMNRVAWLGLDVDAEFGSGNLLRSRKIQPQDGQTSPSSWLPSIAGLFKGRQDKTSRVSKANAASKTHRRRRVQRKVVSAA